MAPDVGYNPTDFEGERQRDSPGLNLQYVWYIDIESLQNRLLKVCYVPASSAGLPRVSFFFSFFVAAAINSTDEANKAGGTYH